MQKQLHGTGNVAKRINGLSKCEDAKLSSHIPSFSHTNVEDDGSFATDWRSIVDVGIFYPIL